MANYKRNAQGQLVNADKQGYQVALQRKKSIENKNILERRVLDLESRVSMLEKIIQELSNGYSNIKN